MPNLVGLPKDEAVKKLKNLGLKDIDVEQAYSHSRQRFNFRTKC